MGPIYWRTGHPSSCLPRHTDRVVGRRTEEPSLTARIRQRHTIAALSTVQAHRGTDGSNPFPSSGESVANSVLPPVTPSGHRCRCRRQDIARARPSHRRVRHPARRTGQSFLPSAARASMRQEIFSNCELAHTCRQRCRCKVIVRLHSALIDCSLRSPMLRYLARGRQHGIRWHVGGEQDDPRLRC